MEITETQYIPGTIPEDDTPLLSEEAGSDTLPVGIFKPVPDVLQLGQQTDVSPICCQTFSPIGAMCTMDWRAYDYDVLRDAWNALNADGKVIYGVGAKLSDGCEYATRFYNKKYKTSWRFTRFSLTPSTLLEYIQKWPIVFGLNGSVSYFQDEQDNGKIDKIERGGNIGHAVTFIKVNTTDQNLIDCKYMENYAKSKTFNVIQANFGELFNKGVFMYSGFVLLRS